MKIVNLYFYMIIIACSFWSCTEDNAALTTEERLRVKSFKLTTDDAELDNQISYEGNIIKITATYTEPGGSYTEIEELHFNEKGDLKYHIPVLENNCTDTAFFDYSNPQKIIKRWYLYNEGPECEFTGTQETTYILNNDGTYKYKSESTHSIVNAYETVDGNIVARYDTTDNFKKVGNYIFDHTVETPENFKLIYMLLFSNDYWVDKNLVVEAREDEYNDIEHHKYDYIFDESGNIIKVDRYLSYGEIPEYYLWYTVDILYETVD